MGSCSGWVERAEVARRENLLRRRNGYSRLSSELACPLFIELGTDCSLVLSVFLFWLRLFAPSLKLALHSSFQWTTDTDLLECVLAAGLSDRFNPYETTFFEHKVNGKSRGTAYIEFLDPGVVPVMKEWFDAKWVLLILLSSISSPLLTHTPLALAHHSEVNGRRPEVRYLPPSSLPGPNPFRIVPKDPKEARAEAAAQGIVPSSGGGPVRTGGGMRGGQTQRYSPYGQQGGYQQRGGYQQQDGGGGYQPRPRPQYQSRPQGQGYGQVRWTISLDTSRQTSADGCSNPHSSNREDTKAGISKADTNPEEGTSKAATSLEAGTNPEAAEPTSTPTSTTKAKLDKHNLPAMKYIHSPYFQKTAHCQVSSGFAMCVRSYSQARNKLILSEFHVRCGSVQVRLYPLRIHCPF